MAKTIAKRLGTLQKRILIIITHVPWFVGVSEEDGPWLTTAQDKYETRDSNKSTRVARQGMKRTVVSQLQHGKTEVTL